MSKFSRESDIFTLLREAVYMLPGHSVMQVLQIVNEFYFGREYDKKMLTLRNDNELLDALRAYVKTHG